MSIFWWTIIIAVCIYPLVLLVSSVIIWAIKREVRKTQSEDIKTALEKMHHIIEPIMNGALIGIILLNLIPMASIQLRTLRMSDSLEMVIFMTNMSIMIIMSVFSLIGVMLKTLQECSKADTFLDKDSEHLERFLLLIGLGAHSFVEGLNIGEQRTVAMVVMMTVLITIHEVFLLPIIILKVFPVTEENWLNSSIVLTMITYALCSPLGIITGAFIMKMEPGNMWIFVALLFSAAAIFYMILNSRVPILNTDSEEDLPLWKKSILFYSGLYLIGLGSYLRSP